MSDVAEYEEELPPPPGFEEDTPNGQVSLTPAIPALAATTGAISVEMSRAITEVQAAVAVARSFPRDIDQATTEMLRSCRQPRMADRAFYRYERGGHPITGPTVQLMRELMRCWRNAQSGIGELQRQPGRSEMWAWAWDLENNVRMSTTFWVTHARDTKKGRVDLTAERDLYENNANMGARRERAMIERMLPAWFVDTAEDECMQTLAGAHSAEGKCRRGDCGRQHSAQQAAELNKAEFAGRLGRTLKAFEPMGVTQPMLEAKVGVPMGAWTALDLSTLTVVYQSLKRQERSLEEEFPEAAAKPPSAAAQAVAEAKKGGGKAPAPEGEQPPKVPSLGASVSAITRAFNKAKWGGQSPEAQRVRLAVVAALAREDQAKGDLVVVKSAKELTPEQAARVARRLGLVLEQAGPSKDPHERLAVMARGVAERMKQDGQ